MRTFALIDSKVDISLCAEEGAAVEKGAVLLRMAGPARSILMGERVGLNLLQHLSGIATRTREAVDQVRGTGARIIDTRKTTPLMRAVEKYAVRVGGGFNHRFNLSDGVLIKDNHILAAGSITDAVKAAQERCAAHAENRSGSGEFCPGGGSPCRGRGYHHAGQHGH